MRIQPQGRIRVRPEWIKKGLCFAFVPSGGFANQSAAQQVPLQTAGQYIKSTSTAGHVFVGGSRAEFPALADANDGLTIVSIWRSRASYLSGDTTRSLVSSKTAANVGWTWGRSSAVAGGANGNITRQSLTFQGVAQYLEADYSIESLVDTPLAMRFNGVTKLISWYRFGAKSSPDTATGIPKNGGNIVLGAQGDFSSNINPWLDHVAVVLVFAGALSDEDVSRLTSSTNSPYQVFEAPEEDFEVLGATSVGATAAPFGVSSVGSVGAASASGGGRASVSGVVATAAVRAVAGSGGGRASPLGVAASASVGAVTASGGGAGTAAPSGVSATASIGAASASGGARAATTGVAALGSVGLAVATGGRVDSIPATASVVGVGATASVGTATASAGARAAPNGVAAFGLIGIAIARSGSADASKVPASRTVVFPGGVRVVAFQGGIRTVRF